MTTACVTTTITRTSDSKARRRPSVGRVLAWIMMIAILITTVLPLYGVLRTALSSNAGISSDPASVLPVDVNVRGFERVFGMQTTQEALDDGGSGAAINFWLYLRNSVVVATLVTVGQVFFSAMAAYSFARLRWKGRDLIFGVFLGVLMVPQIFTLLPNFVLVKQLHLVDSLLGVALPTMFMTPFAVFFLKQFFMNIPRELEEAALLDGASKVRVFLQLILPMAKAPITTLGIITYITAWNDYWTKLTAGFIAGTGPDAFADHIQKFAQLVDLDVLLPLEEQAAWVDVDVSAFQEGLLELWKGEDGHQYGCPKDLGHRGDLLQQGHGALHRPVTGGYGRPGMESGRRRHLREGVGSLDRRRQRRAQRRARVQPGAHRDLRNRHSELRRRRRADPVEPIHRLNR